MANAVSRDVVDAFYEAYISRDPKKIGAMVDDNVEWLVNGPVEVMHVCGAWHGKAAVIDRFATQMPKLIEFKALDIENLLVDGDSSALFGRISCVHLPTGRHICHRVAHIARYRDGKVVSLRVMNDSLDAAEQYVGHHIEFTDDSPLMVDDEIIAV
ncbi:MAG TPA: nuclear transport factor 2 family protein [Pseudolabrys sp.]|jgi:ketosteroid isomerase-like protein